MNLAKIVKMNRNFSQSSPRDAIWGQTRINLLTEPVAAKKRADNALRGVFLVIPERKADNDYDDDYDNEGWELVPSLWLEKLGRLSKVNRLRARVPLNLAVELSTVEVVGFD